MTTKYFFNSLAHRLQVFPDDEHFKLFCGHAYVTSKGRARALDDIIRHFFKPFSQSERAHLLKKYDESMVVDLLENWKGTATSLTPERMNFLYSKIKYRKVMRINSGFNVVDFKWEILQRVFDLIFTTTNERELKPLIIELPQELQAHIIEFCKEVKEIKVAHG